MILFPGSRDYQHYESQAHEINKRAPNYQALMPMFGWLPADVIQQTFAVTTQYARLPMSTLLKKRYKSPFPTLNIHRRDEPVAMDTIYSNTPAVDSGATIAQVFVGVLTLTLTWALAHCLLCLTSNGKTYQMSKMLIQILGKAVDNCW